MDEASAAASPLAAADNNDALPYSSSRRDSSIHGRFDRRSGPCLNSIAKFLPAFIRLAISFTPVRDHRHARWLHREVDRWVREGLVDSSQAERIQARYPLARGETSWLRIGLSVIAALLVGGGILLILAHNWSDLSRPVHATIALAPLVAAQLSAAVLIARNVASTGWREGLGFFWCLVAGGTVAMVGQIYHISPDAGHVRLAWRLSTWPIAYVLNSALAATFYVLLVVEWALSHVERWPDRHAVWLLLAVMLPFVRWRRADGVAYRSGVLLVRWAIAGAAPAALFATLSRNDSGLAVPALFSLFSIYIHLDQQFDRAAPSCWHRPMRVIGEDGAIFFAILLTFESAWDWVFRAWESPDSPYERVVEVLLFAVLFGLASLLLVRRRRRLSMEDFFPCFLYLFVLLSGLVSANETAGTVLRLFLNGALFAHGAILLRNGARRGSPAAANGGMGLMALVAVLRFFDSNLPILARGLAFVAIGIVILVVNLALLAKSRRETR